MEFNLAHFQGSKFSFIQNSQGFRDEISKIERVFTGQTLVCFSFTPPFLWKQAFFSRIFDFENNNKNCGALQNFVSLVIENIAIQMKSSIQHSDIRKCNMQHQQ